MAVDLPYYGYDYLIVEGQPKTVYITVNTKMDIRNFMYQFYKKWWHNFKLLKN